MLSSNIRPAFRTSLLCGILCFIVPLMLAVVFSGRTKVLLFRSPDRTLQSALQIRDLDLTPRSFPVTFLADISLYKTYERFDFTRGVSNSSSADTTAVVLNWSRLPNVINIVSLLCGPWLNDTIAEVFIWNNSPRRLSHRDFSSARCPTTKLRIYNSPSNLYFEARFIACTQASTPYCFIQDDDYLILPEAIWALRFRFEELHSRASYAPSLHLLPPHEHLSSQLRTVHIPSQDIHTSFAWLGHGAIVARSQAVDFLALLRRLNATEAETKMADNYFTILANKIPEIWFDQGIELGGGQPFTVGVEGDERNKRHINQAAQYLSSIVKDVVSVGAPPVIAGPAASSTAETLAPDISRSPCLGTRCLLETNIRLLPETITRVGRSIEDMLNIEERRLKILGTEARGHYFEFPPSHAVDGRPDTAFRSLHNARKGDIISLDMLSMSKSAWTGVEIAWLVDDETEKILRSAAFETSMDAAFWTRSRNVILCLESSNGQRRECSVQMLPDAVAPQARFFRVRLEEDHMEKWCVYEVWMRGKPEWDLL